MLTGSDRRARMLFLLLVVSELLDARCRALESARAKPDRANSLGVWVSHPTDAMGKMTILSKARTLFKRSVATELGQKGESVDQACWRVDRQLRNPVFLPWVTIMSPGFGQGLVWTDDRVDILSQLVDAGVRLFERQPARPPPSRGSRS